MRRQVPLVFAGALAAALALSAQTLPLNASGISAAHEHLIVTDQAASAAFWTALGGTPAQIGTLSGSRLPGIYILYQANRGRGGGRNGAQAKGTAGAGAQPSPSSVPPTPPPVPESSVGSVVEAIGFNVRSLRDTLARLDAIGVKPEAGATAASAAVMSPERVRILLTQDAALATPVASKELLMKVPNPAEAAAWYAKWFGATVVRQGNDSVAQIPGMNMRFVQTTEPVAGTRGRGLDHIGFEVKDLQAFAAKLQEGGVTINTPFRTMSLGFLTAITFITDPWGTYIELNQGYSSDAAK